MNYINNKFLSELESREGGGGAGSAKTRAAFYNVVQTEDTITYLSYSDIT